VLTALSSSKGCQQTKSFCNEQVYLAKGPEFMENRYLPILHETISLSVLPARRQVSNEPLFSWANGW
jgi:hypothetical protein